MAGQKRGSSREREFATLVAELHALEQDIANAHARERAGAAMRGAARPPAARIAGERVALRDGAEVLVRPLEPGDAALLEYGLEHLSALSRYRRFLAPVTHFTRRELDELTHLDHRTHEAVVALDPVERDGVGVARYVCSADDPALAEVWCVVADDWQGRGVGTALVRRLAERARATGLQRLRATMLAGNEGARRLLAQVADDVVERRDGGIVEVEATLRGQAPLTPPRGR